MIKNILPITNLKLEILSELYQRDLNLVNLNLKIDSFQQAIFKTLKKLSEVLIKENNIYHLKEEYRNLLKPILIQKLIEKRLNKNIILLSLIKKYYSPEKIILFGSYARGDYNEKSDIDIYVISNLNEDENIRNILKFSNSLKQEIQIINVNPNIHLTKKDKYSELYTKISTNIKEGIEIDLNNIQL